MIVGKRVAGSYHGGFVDVFPYMFIQKKHLAIHGEIFPTPCLAPPKKKEVAPIKSSSGQITTPKPELPSRSLTASLPLKSYEGTPIGSRIVFQPPFFRGYSLNFGRVRGFWGDLRDS